MSRAVRGSSERCVKARTQDRRSAASDCDDQCWPKRRTHLKPGKDYSYQAIKGFRLEGLHKGGKSACCHSYPEMLKLVSSYLWLRHMDSFAKVALDLRGKKRPYFSKNPAELRKPHKLSASDIFVETNLSANNIVALSRVLLEKLGHDPDSPVLV
jgi:predicted type IV restriction endonuclease